MVVTTKPTVNWLGITQPKYKPLPKSFHPTHFREPNWMGKSKNTPFTTKYPTPSQMFADRDRDGVMNIMDCNPRNPNEQGFIDAVVGAVKAVTSGGGLSGAKQGWSAGMSLEGNPVTRSERYKRFKYPDVSQERVQAVIQKSMSKGGLVKEQVVSQKPQTVEELIQSGKMVENIKKGLKRTEPTQLQKTYNAIPTPLRKTLVAVSNAVGKRSPYYDANLEARLTRIGDYKEALKNKDISPRHRAQLMEQLRNAQRVQATAILKKQISRREKRSATNRSLLQSAFPFVPGLGPTAKTSKKGGFKKTVEGAPSRGRGRPKATYELKYAKYGGVFGYRKALAQQKKLQKLQQRQYEEQMAISRQKAYEQQAYNPEQAQQEQQLPPEMRGQNVQVDYSQYRQTVQAPPQQYQQYQQPQPQMRRPIIINGRPASQLQSSPQLQRSPTPQVQSQASNYPQMVADRPLMPSRTYSDVYEQSDPFTGRRVLVKRPLPEKWQQPGA